MSITKSLFDTYNGEEIYSYTMTNKNGSSVTVLDFGGTINRLFVPDRNGKLADIICGFDRVEDYVTDASNYSGAIVGRYANRMSNGGFTIDGKRYDVENNDGGVCHLHGGVKGFSRRKWQGEGICGNGSDSVTMRLFSPDGEDGYPGNLNVCVTYTFDDNNTLTIHYEAVTDKDTVLNMTSHGYYNLSGYDGGCILDKELYVNADKYDVPNSHNIPEDEPHSVEGTKFDFREMKKIEVACDHNFVLNSDRGDAPAAELYDESTGRVIKLYTDYPALQIYTAEFMNGKTNFKGDIPQRPFHAICLETQYSPDTPNRPYMPSCVLKAGEKYDKTARFVFSVR